MTDKRIYQIGLTMINGVGDILARHLLQALGEAEAVFTLREILTLMRPVSSVLWVLATRPNMVGSLPNPL